MPGSWLSITMRPGHSPSRRVTAALPPASPAPTMTATRSAPGMVMPRASSSLLPDVGHTERRGRAKTPAGPAGRNPDEHDKRQQVGEGGEDQLRQGHRRWPEGEPQAGAGPE